MTSYFGPGGQPRNDPAARQDPNWVPPTMGASGTYRLDDVEDSMSLDEALAILTGQDKGDMQGQRRASLAVRTLDDLTSCGICGQLIVHPPTHVRFHAALAIVAAHTRAQETT